MKQSNRKYRDIVSSGRELIFSHGIRRVSVEEICTRAGTSKMTFYKYFKNKTDLARAILDEIFEDAMKQYDDILNSDISFEDKIRRVITMKLAYAGQYGKEFTEELVSSNEDLKQYIIEKAEQYKNMTIKFIQNGKDSGAINRSFPTEFILYLTDYIRIILADEGLKQIIPDVHERLESLFNFYFYGIMGREKILSD